MDSVPTYTFLSQPPQSKKRCVAQPPTLPPQSKLPQPPTVAIRRPSLTAKITTWALQIQPGSPALPSPQRLTGGIAHFRVPTSPLIHTRAPITASYKTFDFTAIGYNALFAHCPKTPETPAHIVRAKAQKDMEAYEKRRKAKAAAKQESKEKRGKVIKTIKSLANMRQTAKSTSTSKVDATAAATIHSPVSPTHTTATAPMPAPKSRSTTKKSKKTPLVHQLPTFANELALMQFADGGKMSDHIRRAMTERGAVGDVHRDGKGGIWLDQDEELEYRGLLDSTGGDADASSSPPAWVKFSSDGSTELLANVDALPSAKSELEAQAPVVNADEERVPNVTTTETSPVATTLKQGNALLLSIPSRPSRTAKHLRKAEFMADVQAFGLVMTACASGASPSSTSAPLVDQASSASTTVAIKERRRPAPLKISPGMTKMRRVIAVSSPGSTISPLSARQVTALLSPLLRIASPRVPAPVPKATVVPAVNHEQIALEGKKDFLDDSFKPEPPSCFSDDESDYEFEVAVQSTSWTAECKVSEKLGSMMARASRMDLKGMFGVRA